MNADAVLEGCCNIYTTDHRPFSVSAKTGRSFGGGVQGNICKYIFHMYVSIISLENMLDACKEFPCGKRSRGDVLRFEQHLMHNLIRLHSDLKQKTYKHGGYKTRKISDPKPRVLHIAPVRDRFLHHAVHRVLYPFFNKKFQCDSFSSRREKGIHKAMNRFQKFVRIVGKNNTKQCWVLKCDIRKFFANIDHNILISILQKHITDTDTLWLCERIIRSFNPIEGKGLPLGNLTSQLFANVYMNEFDQFVKHVLKEKYYIRYADYFLFLSRERGELENIIPIIQKFLSEKLKLSLHEDKLFIKTIGSGVDFLGWVHFPDHRVLRTTTKRRMLKHGNAEKLKNKIKSLA